MTELYVTKSVQAQAQIALSQMFSEALIKIIQENWQAASNIYVRQFDSE